VRIALNIELVGARRGGAEKYAGSLARALTTAGHEVHVVARQVDAGELPSEVQVHPVRLRRLPGLGWLRAYRFAAASQRVLQGLEVDLTLGFAKVWHQDAYLSVGGPHPASLDCSRLRFRSWAMRTLWDLGKLLSLRQWAFWWIDHKQFHGSRQPHVIAPSRMSAEHFRHYHGIPAERISVVYNGLDHADPLPDAAEARRRFREQHGLADDNTAVLFAAHNYSLKGLQPLLEAFAPVAARYPKARLIICGGRQKWYDLPRIRRLRLAGQVQFLGFVDDVRECFAGCDLFAFPSFYDPCSLVVLEAMAAGLPVITTRQNGASELLTDGIDGYVIDSPWAIEQLTQQLQRLIGNDLLRRRMGQEAAKHVQAFNLDVRLKELLAVLNQIAAQTKEPRPSLQRSAA
jgi:UDP-glucose:(heptosyl)LPS alpha-1,3-glucosyltransferase